MKFLCLTHSSRKFFAADSSFNTLEMRFSDKARLDDLPPMETFPGVDQAVPYDGALSVWRIDRSGRGVSLAFLFQYAPGYKVQSAAFHEDHLIVYGSDRLEVLDVDLNLVRTIRHPLMVGGHTVFIDNDGHAVVTSAPANSVFRLDLQSGEVLERIEMPERYGLGHSIDGKDLHAHYIPTDSQPTHVNCAYPTDDGLLVTLWIPGAVGHFNEARGYREIVTGLRGCHGGKRFAGNLYLSDSAAGTVLFLDPASGEVRRRLSADSRWLHDAEQIDDDTLAVALGDRNEIRLIDAKSGEVLFREACDAFGESVMFVSSFEVSPAWPKKYEPAQRRRRRSKRDATYGPELLAPMVNFRGWSVPEGASVRIGSTIQSSDHEAHAYLLSGEAVLVARGRYRFRAELKCHKGSVMLGLLNVDDDSWLASAVFDRENETVAIDVSIPKRLTVRPVLTATEERDGETLVAEILLLSLRKRQKVNPARVESALKERLPQT